MLMHRGVKTGLISTVKVCVNSVEEPATHTTPDAWVLQGHLARMRDAGSPAPEEDLMGTIGYLSPELASGAAPSPAMDIFSAGLVLAEMLTGRRLLAESDVYSAIYRVTHEQLVLPASVPAGVDDRLRAIVQRALALDAQQRFASASLFRSELVEWTDSLKAPAAEQATGADATLEFLLRRMRHKSDFPALSDSISRTSLAGSSGAAAAPSRFRRLVTPLRLKAAKGMRYLRATSSAVVLNEAR